MTWDDISADGAYATIDKAYRTTLGKPKTQGSYRDLELTPGLLHMLRHFFASHLLSMNMPLMKVQKLLGHSKASMTLDVYSQYMLKDSDMTTTDLFEGDLDTNWTQKEKALRIVNDSKGLREWWRCRDWIGRA